MAGRACVDTTPRNPPRSCVIVSQSSTPPAVTRHPTVESDSSSAAPPSGATTTTREAPAASARRAWSTSGHASERRYLRGHAILDSDSKSLCNINTSTTKFLRNDAHFFSPRKYIIYGETPKETYSLSATLCGRSARTTPPCQPAMAARLLRTGPRSPPGQGSCRRICTPPIHNGLRQ